MDKTSRLPVRPVLLLVLLSSDLFAAGGAPPPAPAPVAPADPAAHSAEQRLAVLRRKVLRDEDFVESDGNRDPFRSYLSLFIEKTPVARRTVPAIFDKFALEEISLIAVVSGTDKPLAMFRDPGGLGQVVKRGDYLSKSGARVTKILGDRVILELNEVVGTGEARAIEKAILVNPEAAQQ
ncbi:MAG: pilus assembly protein PilP [Myxococcales bacterium]|nr:pilus assembly protein PilP [Myxococcales bacterium]